MGSTLSDKLWENHMVRSAPGEPDLLYIDLQLVHEVTSPQAFDGLRLAGRTVRRTNLTMATEDHNTPTLNILAPIADPVSRLQVDTLRKNADEFGIRRHSLGDKDQGVVHIIGPQLGLTQPGLTVVCGDSHTSTHGAFGALAFGIGTSEVEHVLAAQCLLQRKPKPFEVRVDGVLRDGVSAKDIVLAVIAKLGIGGGTGCVFEFRGEAITALSMEGRMTVCNMSIEAGARAGLIAPDEKTWEFLRGRKLAPQGAAFDAMVAAGAHLVSDDGAVFTGGSVTIDASALEPMITWGTNPGMGMAISAAIPDPSGLDPSARASAEKALTYMGFEAGKPILGQKIDVVFVGSCTNSRLSDLQAAAAVLKDKKVAAGVRMLVVPGSVDIKREAEALGLDRIFTDAGAEWRDAGCSMCIAMNGDIALAGQYAVSTSNRNFEGRQGRGSRTMLASPATAAASAVAGVVADPRQMIGGA